MLKLRSIPIDQSNIAGLGSSSDIEIRMNAAKSEIEYKNAGNNIGIEIWRIEKFTLKKQNIDQKGIFYTGDSYIILNTYLNENQKKLYNLHFWLGNDSTQDERGSAAYFTVNLDDLLHGLPVQYRETQGNESEHFLNLFPQFILMSGGIASGFNTVKPAEYSPRMLHIYGNKSHTKAIEVPLNRDSMNEGDTFLVDAGKELYLWQGSLTSPFERSKGAELAQGLKGSRGGCKLTVLSPGNYDNDEFWNLVGGPGPIASATPEVKNEVVEAPRSNLWRLSDVNGGLAMQLEQEGALSKDKLNGNDIFFIDTNKVLIIWVGQGASIQEKGNSLAYAQLLLKSESRPDNTKILRVMQDCENADFWKYFSN